jgi:DNA-binding LytR/AlgR family response regulator
LVFKAESLPDANVLFQQHQPKILFLDIEINKKNSLKWAKLLEPKTQIVVTSSYPEYAIEAFDTEVAHFLVKPIEFTSFLKVVDVLLNKFQNTIQNNNFFYCKIGHNEFHRLNYNDVYYVKAEGDYVKIICRDNKNLLAYLGLKDLKKQLPQEIFGQISRSVLVNLTLIEKVVDDLIHIQDYQLPIGNTYRDNFFKNYINNKILKRESRKKDHH